MIRHYIWDFDGTLFDTYPAMNRALREALTAIGSPAVPSAEEAEQVMRTTMGAAFQAFVTDQGLDEQAFFAVYNPLRRRLELELAHPFAEIPPLLRKLRDEGGRHYIFTHRGPSTRDLLEKNDLIDLFSDMALDGDGFPRKPAPDAILHLLQKHDLSPAETLMIGDRDLDMRAGQNAGVHTLRILSGAADSGLAEWTVQDHAELFEALPKIR